MNRVRIYHRAQQVLPTAIQTAGLRGLAMSAGQLRYLLFGLLLSHESRGAVVLELARHVVAAIQREGLAYFEGATRSRGALAGGTPSYYEAWRHLSSEQQDGHHTVYAEWMGVMDDGVLPGERRGLEAAWHDDAYLTRDIGRDAWLAVLPAAAVVLYSWRDAR